jgi:hypothetical protein
VVDFTGADYRKARKPISLCASQFTQPARPDARRPKARTTSTSLILLDYPANLHKNANMRTSVDFPDVLFRHLKARAALEGTSLRELVLQLIERGLSAPASAPVLVSHRLPSVSLGAPVALAGAQFSNARLSRYLDELPD